MSGLIFHFSKTGPIAIFIFGVTISLSQSSCGGILNQAGEKRLKYDIFSSDSDAVVEIAFQSPDSPCGRTHTFQIRNDIDFWRYLLADSEWTTYASSAERYGLPESVIRSTLLDDSKNGTLRIFETGEKESLVFYIGVKFKARPFSIHAISHEMLDGDLWFGGNAVIPEYDQVEVPQKVADAIACHFALPG